MGSSHDLCLHLLYFDYPFPEANIYLIHDDFRGQLPKVDSIFECLGNEMLTRIAKDPR